MILSFFIAQEKYFNIQMALNINILDKPIQKHLVALTLSTFIFKPP